MGRSANPDPYSYVTSPSMEEEETMMKKTMKEYRRIQTILAKSRRRSQRSWLLVSLLMLGIVYYVSVVRRGRHHRHHYSYSDGPSSSSSSSQSLQQQPQSQKDMNSLNVDVNMNVVPIEQAKEFLLDIK